MTGDAILIDQLRALVEMWYAEADGLLDDQEGREPDDTNGRDKARAEIYAACAKELDALLARPADPHGWQPIETAPKTGEWFLGWNRDCGCFVWRDGPGLITGEDPAPTHWMPLPARPADGQELK